MVFENLVYRYAMVTIASCLTFVHTGNTVSLLKRLNSMEGYITETATFPTTSDLEINAAYEPSIIPPMEAYTCSSNSSYLNTNKVVAEIRNVGATCRRQCGGSANGNDFSTEMGEFTRRLQLLQLTVEGLALMLNDAMERLAQPNAPKFLKSPYPKDCNEVLERGQTSNGVYTIHPEGCGPPFQVYCDMVTADGGWTVFQRRVDGSTDFDKGWGSYRRGFGDLLDEFWLGNDKLHRLSFQDEYELRIDMELFNGTKSYAKYEFFWIGDVHAKYRLHIGTYNGTAGDSLGYHNELPFTTVDKDNDLSYTNCAEIYSGAWWFNKCHYSNLNGRYLGQHTEEFAKGIIWFEFSGYYSSLKHCEMKIRSKF